YKFADARQGVGEGGVEKDDDQDGGEYLHGLPQEGIGGEIEDGQAAHEDAHCCYEGAGESECADDADLAIESLRRATGGSSAACAHVCRPFDVQAAIDDLKQVPKAGEG